RVGPVSHISRRSEKVTRRRLRLRGSSTDRVCVVGKSTIGRVSRVDVFLGKPQGHKRCRFLNRKGRLGKKRACSRPVYLRAKLRGSRGWTLTKKVRLPKGKYIAGARGTDRSGHVERPSIGRIRVR
ncbi:MAG: hypothetical protein ACJ77M_15570, partial [Thermoleophilaceae bacterium]